MGLGGLGGLTQQSQSQSMHQSQSQSQYQPQSQSQSQLDHLSLSALSLPELSQESYAGDSMPLSQQDGPLSQDTSYRYDYPPRRHDRAS
jgi:hypothetical protein